MKRDNNPGVWQSNIQAQNTNPRPQRDTSLARPPHLVDLEDGHQCCLQVVALPLLGVEDLNGMLPAFQVDDRSSIEILGEQVNIHRG